jgi:hypothetical protein
MRTTVALLLILCLFSSRKYLEERDTRKDIAGKWELERNVTPWFDSVFASGNGGTLIFGKNGKYERRQGNALLFRGRYYLEYKKDCYSSKREMFLDTDENESFDNLKVEVTNGKLRVSTTSCLMDGGVAIYRRLE